MPQNGEKCHLIDQTHIHTNDCLSIVTEPGLSPGAVAGIVVAVLLLVAAAAAGVIYHRRKISELQKNICKYYS